MKIYVVSKIQSDYKIKNRIVCLCQTKADAEEMVLAFTEDQPYDEYIDYMSKYPLKVPSLAAFFYDPLSAFSSDYYLDDPMEVLP